ncbi:MAG: sulfite exporter TauE/SafE family protein, partial [Comamonadaceae bacterium]
FGFSAIAVAGLSLIVSPAQVVPAIFALEILASLSQLRGISRTVDRHWIGWLALGNLIFIPVGVALLAWLPEAPLRLLIGALLMTAAILLRGGHQATLAHTRGVRLFAGAMSGFINGVAAIGGIALAVLLSTTRMPPATLRATMIALLLFSDVVALASAALMPDVAGGGGKLLGPDTWRWALWLAPAMLAGIWFGQRSFAGVSPEQFRRQVLNLLIALAAVSVLRSLYGLLA